MNIFCKAIYVLSFMFFSLVSTVHASDSQQEILIQNLINLLEHDLATRGNEYYKMTPEEYKQALADYNALRDYYNLSHATSFNTIDMLWIIATFGKDLVKHKATYLEPTKAQELLLQEAKNIIRLKNNIVLITGSSATGRTNISSIPYLALCAELDLDMKLFALYHELGHIVHNDINLTDITDPRKRIIPWQDKRNDPAFIADIQRVKKYFQLGKYALNLSTSIGNNIYEHFKEINLHKSNYRFTIEYPEKQYWIDQGIVDTNKLDEIIYSRNIERRADLFAIEQLFALKQINAILSGIEHFVDKNMDDILKQNTIEWLQEQTEHPLDLERALYMIGFLVDKGIDVNKAFQEWESHGICLNAEEEYDPFLYPQQPQSRASSHLLGLITGIKGKQKKLYPTAQDEFSLEQLIQKFKSTATTILDKSSWETWFNKTFRDGALWKAWFERIAVDYATNVTPLSPKYSPPKLIPYIKSVFFGERKPTIGLNKNNLNNLIIKALQNQAYKYALDSARANFAACNNIAHDPDMKKHLEYLIYKAEVYLAEQSIAAASYSDFFKKLFQEKTSTNLHYLTQLWQLINQPLYKNP